MNKLGFLVCSLLFASALGQLQCGDWQCGFSDLCCRTSTAHQCYNPDFYECMEGQILCGKGGGVCNGQCYDSRMYTCYSDESGQLLCPLGTQKCGDACFEPEMYRCTEGRLEQIEQQRACGSNFCQEGEECCEGGANPGVCFKSSTQTCCRGTILTTVCDLTSDGTPQACCGTFNQLNCYDPRNSICCESRFGAICQIDDTQCCPSQ